MDDLHIGFTGSRFGMAYAQREAVRDLLAVLRKERRNTFHHGDCVGADAEAHDLVRGVWAVEIHPSSISTRRAFCRGAWRVYPVKPPLERNKDIVDACSILIATPGTSTEVQRSGTWATVRYARKQGKEIYIVWPSGKLQHKKA